LRCYVAFLSEGDVSEDKPLYKVLLEELRKAGISGATVIKGYAGYGKHRGTSELDPFHGYGDKPVMVMVIEDEEKGEAFVRLVKKLKGDALVVSWEVDVH
jgi:PII-like signaling protein